jgi:hypothetical protein
MAESNSISAQPVRLMLANLLSALDSAFSREGLPGRTAQNILKPFCRERLAAWNAGRAGQPGFNCR